MNAKLEKIINAESIMGETIAERDKRMSTENADDSAVRQRLWSIYKENPAFEGVTFLNVEDKLLNALIPNQENANNINGNKQSDVQVTSNKINEEKRNMAAEDQMKQFGNGAAPRTEGAAATATAGDIVLSEKDKKTLEKAGISEQQLTAWAKDSAKVNSFKTYVSSAEIGDLLTVKGPVKNRIIAGAEKAGISNTKMHYALGGEPVVGILARLAVPGKDYSKLTGDKAYNKDQTPKEPRENIKFRLQRDFGYNPSTGECDPGKLGGDPEITAKWVDYLYKLVNDASTVKEAVFDDNAFPMLHLNDAKMQELKAMGPQAALNAMKDKNTRVPFGNDLFVVDPNTLNAKAALSGCSLSVNGKQLTATDLGNTKYWPLKVACTALDNLGIRVATSSNGNVTLKVVETEKDGKTSLRPAITYRDGQPKCTMTAKSVANDKVSWVKVRITLPVDLKYIAKSKDGQKNVTKKFNIYGYVPVAATWEPISTFPQYVSLKTRTTTSSGTGRKTSAQSLSKVLAGTSDAMENIQALLSLGKNINIAELVKNGTISTKTDQASVDKAQADAQSAFLKAQAEAEANRKAAAEKRKNKV